MDGTPKDIILQAAPNRKGWFFLCVFLCALPLVLASKVSYDEPLLGGVIKVVRGENKTANVYEPEHLNAVNSILTLSGHAPAILASLQKKYPGHPANIYLENYQAFIQFVATEKPLDIETFVILSERRIRLIEKTSLLPSVAVYKCNIYLQMAAFEAINNQPVRALKCFYKANQQFKQIPATNIYLQEYHKLLSLFALVQGVIPQELKWLAGIVIKNEVVKDAPLAWVRYAEKHHEVEGLGLEAVVIQLLFDLKLNQSLPMSQSILQDAVSQSPLAAYLAGMVQFKKQQKELSITDLSDKACRKFPPLYYVRGRMLLNNLQPAPAIDDFDQFQAQFKGNSFKIDALLRKAWSEILQGKLYTDYRLILTENNLSATTYADKQALIELERLAEINVQLLKSRLLYDGGQPQRAIELLQNYKVIGGSHQCEFHYRLARAYQKRGNYPFAMQHFNSCIVNNSNNQRYFAPQAALQMAIIEYEMGKIESAKKHIKMCLALNKGEYSGDIKLKANELLQKINLEGSN